MATLIADQVADIARRMREIEAERTRPGFVQIWATNVYRSDLDAYIEMMRAEQPHRTMITGPPLVSPGMTRAVLDDAGIIGVYESVEISQTTFIGIDLSP
jgi:hypothetical protein